MPFLIGAGSACDVCADTFGSEDCAPPCSIECGHVFCLKCLNTILKTRCPMCRQRFDPQSVVRLHIGVEEVRPPSRTEDRPPRALFEDEARAPAPSEDEAEAARFQERIATAANAGTTEQNARQIIDECREFLSKQPREMFSALRVSLRMINHVYNVKLDQLALRQEVKRLSEEVVGLQTEKSLLENMVKELEADMSRDRENWQTLEANLREYCSRAQGAYFGVAELYLKTENERTMLRDTLRQLGYNAPYALPIGHKPQAPQMYAAAAAPTPADLPELPPPSSDLFSPIPEVMAPDLPSTVSVSNIALLAEGEDGPDKIGPIPKLARCGKIGCPFSCECQSIDLFDDPSRLLSSVTHVASHATGGSNYSAFLQNHQTLHSSPTSLASTSPEGSSKHSPSNRGSTRSALSLTAPEKVSQSTSKAVIRPGSPIDANEGSRLSSYPQTPEAPPVSSRGVPMRMSSYHQSLNPRIQDLSSESSSRSSSSLPNLASSGSHFPTSLSAQHSERDVDPSSRRSDSKSRSASRVSPLTSNEMPIREPEMQQNDASTGSQHRSQTRVSSASEAAKALERQHKERGRSSRHKEREKDKEMNKYDERSRQVEESQSSRNHRKDKERNSPDYEASKRTSTSRRRGEDPPSLRSSRHNSSTAPSVPPPPRTPTHIYGAVPPIMTPSWTHAQSPPPYIPYHASAGSSKAKMMASATATYA